MCERQNVISRQVKIGDVEVEVVAGPMAMAIFEAHREAVLRAFFERKNPIAIETQAGPAALEFTLQSDLDSRHVLNVGRWQYSVFLRLLDPLGHAQTLRAAI